MAGEVSTWIDPYGASTVLDVDWEATGRFFPEILFETQGVPGQPGERLRAVRHGVREFTIRITLTAASEAALRSSQRATVASMDPFRGAGILRVQSPIGDVRDISCFVASGLGMEEKPGNSGPTMQQMDVTFRAFDPYWQDSADISTSYTIGVTPTFFPIFPLRLTSSQIAVDATVVNGGDVEAWPVWQVIGPGSAITLRNLTTGKLMNFATTILTAGQYLTIDTRTAVATAKTVTREDGSNAFPDLSATSALWPLPVGSSAVRLEMGGAIAGSSSLQLNYRQRYLAP